MLDTSSRANFKPTAEIDDLDALAREVSKHLQASAAATQNFLEHAIAAGDALQNGVGEILISNQKVGSHLDMCVRDLGAAASLALQFGCSLDKLRRSLLR